jgi:hypothetical protein
MIGMPIEGAWWIPWDKQHIQDQWFLSPWELVFSHLKGGG